MKTKLFGLLSLLVLFLASCSTQSLPVELSTLKVSVRLASLSGSSSYPSASGKATYKVDKNGIREFQAELQGVLSLKGKTLDVFVGSKKVGTMRINSLGKGRLSLVGSAAPIISDALTPLISIKTSTSILVASGRMNQFK